MYTIKEVSEMMNISPHTLRFYDNQGLFPYVIRGNNNVRLFSDYDLEWVDTIQCLRSTGLSLAGIKKYIALYEDGDSTLNERYHIILEQKKKAEEEINNMKQRLATLEKKAHYYESVLQNKQIDHCNPLSNKLEKNRDL